MEQEKETNLEKSVDFTTVSLNDCSAVRGVQKTPIKENDNEEIKMTFEKSGLDKDNTN